MTGTSWLSLGIFLTVYVFISTERINKTVAALLGAAVYLILHVIDQRDAFLIVDWNVIFLLVSMMIVVGITKTTGLFQYVAIRTAKAALGDPLRILLMLSLVTALFSAFLDNVTTILILTPVTILIAVELGISPVPFIISQTVASNIGGTATLIGDPPNIMIGSAAGIDFASFLFHLGPVILINLLVFSGLTWFFFRKDLVVTTERKARIMEFDESRSIENIPLLVKSLAVLALVVTGFLLHGFLGLEAASIALLGAAVLLLLSRKHEPDEYYREVEWGTIFFFIGLFILVGGLVELGLIKILARWVMRLTQGDLRLTAVMILWVSGIFSAVVDNIPYVATMIPLLQDILSSASREAALPLWWSLSLGACLGGNGTLVGASANVVAAGLSGKSGYHISFLEFTRYGAVYTLVSLGISTIYILVRYF